MESEAEHLSKLNTLLRVVARYEHLFEPGPFDEVVAAVRALIPFGQMAIGVASGPNHFRIYALSPGPAALAPLKVRFPAVLWIRDKVYGQGKIHLCEDTRAGEPVERLIADAGFLSYYNVPIKNPEGKVVASLILAFADAEAARRVSEERLLEVAGVLGLGVERAARASRERRWAMILETSGDAMLAWDAEGSITDANDAAVRLTGRERDELIGKPIDMILIPLAAAVDGGKQPPTSGERLRLKTDGGEEVVVAATTTSVPGDPAVAAHTLLRDLSEVVAAEREAARYLASLRELEERHRALLDNAPLVIFQLDPETGELVFLNRYAEDLLGVSRLEAERTPGFLRELHVDPEGMAAFDHAFEFAKSGLSSAPYEARIARRAGDPVTVRGNLYPIVAFGQQVIGVEGVLADISTEHAARTRLVQTDRLSTLGMLAAGVAHEINNPAAFILLGLDMLGRLLTGPGVTMTPSAQQGIDSMVHELRDSIQRIVDIARDLRLFAGPPNEPGRQTVVDVVGTVESALTLTRGQILERARIDCDLREVAPVLMEDGRLGQVIVNLLVNAAQAIPKTMSRDHAVSIATRSDGQSVEIEVQDTGQGIPETVIGRIWTPFFTTKGPDVGTGLGLSISRSIIERAGGRIRAESPPPGLSQGSRFVIELPAAGRTEQRTPMSTPLPRIPATREKLLIVEDEPALARALADQLSMLHEVEIADGGEEALRRFETKRFAVVLCDLRMPSMSGEALFGQVAERYPDQLAGFIFMTGVGFGADVERFLSSAGRPVLEKPFSVDAALACIAKVLARRRREGNLTPPKI